MQAYKPASYNRHGGASTINHTGRNQLKKWFLPVLILISYKGMAMGYHLQAIEQFPITESDPYHLQHSLTPTSTFVTTNSKGEFCKIDRVEHEENTPFEEQNTLTEHLPTCEDEVADLVQPVIDIYQNKSYIHKVGLSSIAAETGLMAGAGCIGGVVFATQTPKGLITPLTFSTVTAFIFSAGASDIKIEINSLEKKALDPNYKTLLPTINRNLTSFRIYYLIGVGMASAGACYTAAYAAQYF